MWVKICANTNADDALEAVRLGADALGFVFARSTRQVTAEEVGAIGEQLPEGIERVGVFSAVPAEEIVHCAKTAKLTTVQLHGGYDPALARAVAGQGLQVIHTVHWTVNADDESAARVTRNLAAIAKAEPGARVLIDARVGSASGGTGVSFDWQRAKEILSGHADLRIIVAGGLRPETVAEAIDVLRPWGVDVASGVELNAGRKEWEKLKTFIENARQA